MLCSCQTIENKFNGNQCLFFPSRVSWNFGLPVTVIGSITVMVLITSVIGVIFCRVKTKQSGEQTLRPAFCFLICISVVILFFFLDKYGETLNESLKQEAPVSEEQGTCRLSDSASLVFKKQFICASDFLYSVF